MKTDNTTKKMVILGGGESGVGAAILAKDKGMDVFLSDNGTIAPRYIDILNAENIEWEQGGHSVDRILQADEVVKSPGIPHCAIGAATRGQRCARDFGNRIRLAIHRCQDGVHNRQQWQNHHHHAHISDTERCRNGCGAGRKCG